ncbi:MAG: hypothetical protein M3177_00940 [Pseudomonadota bacterium]|nr:hypothetical protein [Pseudomonadota bacterium]
MARVEQSELRLKKLALRVATEKVRRLTIVAAVSTMASLSALAQPIAARAVTVPPSVEMLLKSPSNPIAYHEAKERVRSFVWQREGSAAEAERLAEMLVREYPQDGENWLLLGRVNSRGGRSADAAVAFERAGEILGWGRIFSPRFNAAISHLEAGNRRRALDLIRQEIFEGRSDLRFEIYEWPEFAPLRDDPEFREIAGRLDTTGWSRDYGWRRDLQHLRAEVARVHPDFRGTDLPAELTRRYDDLWRDIPQLADEEIYVRMGQMLATLRTGHTQMMGFPRGHGGSHKLPVRFFVFPEGVYIIDAAREYRHLIGRRVVRIGEASAEEALERVNTTQPVESEMFHLFTGPQHLRSAAHLRGLGIVPADAQGATLTLETNRGRLERVNLPLGSHDVPSHYNLLPAPEGVAPPLFLSNQAEKHWDLPIPQQDALYVQLYNVHDEPRESLRAYGIRLRETIGRVNPSSVILDLRHNTGGSTATYPELLRTLVAFSQTRDRQLFVLIGRASYSAASNLITDLERLADPIFVGEATGQCCSLGGDPNRVALPYSGVEAWVAASRWNLSSNVFDERGGTAAEVPVQLTARDYFAGRDPVLETVFQLIERRRGDSANHPQRPNSREGAED